VSGPVPFTRGDTVTVRPDASSWFGGRAGVVVTVEKWRRGPRTTVTKYDYGLRFGASGIVYFEHAELVERGGVSPSADEPGETQ
jgi:hypothetical protein